MEKTKKKFSFKMPTAFTILLGILAVIAILSWIVKGSFTTPADPDNNVLESVEEKRANIGLFAALFLYPLKGFVDAADLVVFLLVIGGFIGIMMETQSMESGMISLLKKLNGKEIYAIIALMTLFSFGGTTYGMAEETIAFYPILIPILMLAGYDALTGFLVISIGAGTGVAASTVNPFAIGAAVAAVDESTLTQGTGAAIRWISWVGMTAGSIAFVTFYAHKVKKNPEKSAIEPALNAQLMKKAQETFDMEKTPKLTKRKLWAMILFGFTFIVMIMAVIPWASFGESAAGEFDGFTGFDDLQAWLNKYLFVIFGGLESFGNYWFTELASLFFFSFIILSIFFFKKGEKGTIKSFMNGAKDLLSVALIISVARGIKVILADTGFSEKLISSLADTLSGLGSVGFIALLFVFMIILSFLIPSTSGLAGAAFPVIGGVAISIGGVELAALSVTAFSFGSGIVNMITPTSGVVMGAVELSGVPYTTYTKKVLPYLGVLTAASLFILMIGAAIL